MLTVVIFFLAVSLLLYVLFGGADYGAGILEMSRGRTLPHEQSAIIDRAIGPVWEANHIWLILVVVILFTGFPSAYAIITTHLHLPLVVALLGIVLRGTAFTFAHYDAVQDRSQRVYSRVFMISSLVAPFWLGVVAGAVAWGRIDPQAVHFHDRYVLSWLGVFPLLVGLFSCSLFAFIAAVYLIGETREPALRDIFIRRAKQFNVATVAIGAAVLIVGKAASPIPLALASISLVPLWKALSSGKVLASRLLVGFQVSQILIGWYAEMFPRLIVTRAGALTFHDLAAPEKTLEQLALALIAGASLILPALAYLLLVFKRSRT